MSHRSRRGFTLKELLVVLPLLLVLSGVIYEALISSSRKTATLTAQAQLQEVATITLRRLERDLCTTPAAGLAIHLPASEDDLSIVSLHALVDVDPSGIRTYTPRLRVYVHHPTRGVLVFREWTALPDGTALDPLEPCRPTTEQLLRLATDPNPRERVIAHDVTAFTLTSDAPTGQIGNPLLVRLLLQRHAVSSEIEQFELRRTYTLRN